MTYPTVDPESGIPLNSAGTDIVLLWFVEETKKEWLSAVIKAALWQFKGQWRYDLQRGIPYLEDVFTSNPDVQTIGNLFRAEIAKIAEVDLVASLTINFDGKETLSVDWLVISEGVPIEGSTTLSGTPDEPYPFVFGCAFGPEFG